MKTNLNDCPSRALGERAAQAWCKLDTDQYFEPVSVEALKVSGRNSETKKSAVYRLVGEGSRPSSVIAKRCRTWTAQTESLIYAEVLPHLPVASPAFHGVAEDENDEYSWLLFEDVGEETYSLKSPEERAMAGSWLGALHSAAATLVGSVPLPNRGPDYYLKHLRRGRENLRGAFSNPVLDEESKLILEQIDSHMEFIETRWGKVVDFGSSFPRTLAHSDFIVPNARLYRRGAENCFVAFDWEIAGWGTPVADLAQFTGLSISPDLEAYREAVRERWPRLDDSEIEAMAQQGLLFRSIIAASWESESLCFAGADSCTRNMAIFHRGMMRATDPVVGSGA